MGAERDDRGAEGEKTNAKIFSHFSAPLASVAFTLAQCRAERRANGFRRINCTQTRRRRAEDGEQEKYQKNKMK